MLPKLEDYILKEIKTKHILPKFFYIHELQESRQVNVKQIHFFDNLADIFTKLLLTSIFEKIIYNIGMRRVNKLNVNNAFLQGDLSENVYMSQPSKSCLWAEASSLSLVCKGNLDVNNID